MSEERSLKQIQKAWPQTLTLYLTGFIICLILTALSFFLGGTKALRRDLLIVVLVFLAVVQAFVQLAFFMHLTKHSKPRWMLIVFGFMVLVLVIVVTLSMWIMFDLNARVMPLMK
ncbi:MAG: cytochrome o ubiquinol oxidase subunit IV [Verrucomicrobia bacterium]|nr:cytochrome o ubiquinol oxidase subunit IV [Verrucomicrobiota bacterium]MBU6446649.1 cytochrome o ubiquinol oxidase subunit IV [Verrucomicrobiota bacterium]MDE3047738.1 cytochrome o ubiquinol oxidase subunit IV [Verrucomicrobiota bacterium]